jgi:hypothetical protein
MIAVASCLSQACIAASPRLAVPEMTDDRPAAGKRVRCTAPEYKDTQVYHSLYLPADWKQGDKYPVMVEYTGNRAPFCKSTGEVKDANLGYCITGGRGWIWIVMPYIEKDRKSNAVKWWGDRQATIDYCKMNLPRICDRFDGDTDNVFLCGFSRGAIACNFIGLGDEEIAKLWKGFIAHDHYDGVRNWGYPKADRASALERLNRLAGRPQLITSGEHRLHQQTKTYLDQFAQHGKFTFIEVPVAKLFRIPDGKIVHPHTDLWMCIDSPQRRLARKWLQGVLKEKKP